MTARLYDKRRWRRASRAFLASTRRAPCARGWQGHAGDKGLGQKGQPLLFGKDIIQTFQ